MNTGASSLEVDLFTPMLPKDIKVFRELRRSVHEFLRHPVSNHFVIGPHSARLQAMCEEEGCIFVEETSVLGITPHDLRPHLLDLPADRSGWLFQQLLKLSSDSVSQSPAILILDADTVFVSDVQFERQGKFLLQYTDGYMECYDEATQRLLPNVTLSPFSFVCHQMLMHSEHLAGLRRHLERIFNRSWIDAILDVLPAGSFQPFSEYELYGNYVLSHDPRSYFLEYWFNATGNLNEEFNLGKATEQFGRSYRTVSMHYYMRQPSFNLDD